MIVRWTPDATRDLERLHDFLAANDVDAAQTAISTLYERVEALAATARRQPRLAGTRFSKLSVRPYIVLLTA